MKTQNVKMQCPNCKTEIDIDSILINKFHDSLKQDLESEFETRLNEARTSMFMETRQKDSVINDLKAKIEEMRRKVSQGSMQLQGEVQEEALKELLIELHPTDEIADVKKGQCGADLIHYVRTQSGVEIGKILYESKNTKSFSEEWITKMKTDNLVTKADILIIVTKTMPKDIKGSFGIMDGVWVCTFNSVKDLTLVLRFGLLKLQSVLLTQEAKETKAELLYEYLTSESFKNMYESLLKGFNQIEESYNSEQTKMKKLWAERSKVLQLSKSNAVEMYGTLKGIAGNAILDIPMLEFRKAG